MHEITDRPEHAPPPADVTEVKDRYGDVWTRTEEGWKERDYPGGALFPWERLTTTWGPMRWRGQKFTPAPEPRQIGIDPGPDFEGGHYWCPSCQGQLVDPGPSDTVWHHIFGTRGRCTWTD